jgi:putative tryptophan/tyrosine transport system substrate-binding protein
VIFFAALRAGQMAIKIGRRQFISALGCATAAWPLAAQAQQPPMPVVGFLSPGSASGNMYVADALRRGLAETGYIEGRNVAIEYRWADGQYDQLPALAADLVRRRVTVIAALGTSAPGRAAKTATSTTPIVFQTGADPVEDGLVASLNRPGGNITGVSRMNVATDSKRLELLHDTVPNASVIACLVNPTSQRSASQVQHIQDSARLLGLNLQIVNASTDHDLETAFATIVQGGTAALLVAGDPYMNAMQEQIARLALKHGVATIADHRSQVVAGFLMSYDASLPDSFRQAGVYVGRILKGEKPADLPVLQPTKFELVINLKTAKTLGIEIPPKILALADEVIE